MLEKVRKINAYMYINYTARIIKFNVEVSVKLKTFKKIYITLLASCILVIFSKDWFHLHPRLRQLVKYGYLIIKAKEKYIQAFYVLMPLHIYIFLYLLEREFYSNFICDPFFVIVILKFLSYPPKSIIILIHLNRNLDFSYCLFI